jgi:hypothetical protein
MNHHPINAHADRAIHTIERLDEDVIADEGITDATIIATALEANTQAVLALAHEQHQRNRLAAHTAKHRGLDLPTDLTALAEEGPR